MSEREKLPKLKTNSKFYRNLGMKSIEAREPPSMAEAETYWKSL